MNPAILKIAFLPGKFVILIAIGVAALFYISPFYDDGSSLENQVKVLQEELILEENKKVKTQQILSERDRLLEKLTTLTENYEELSRKIPSELPSVEVNRQLNEIIQASKLRPLSRTPGKAANIGILDEIPMEFDFIGGFPDVGQFIYLVSTSERVMLIKSFELKPMSQNYNGLLSFKVKMALYKLAEAPDISKLKAVPK
jgi:Tfp pilus assembly protein PilO